MTDDLRRSLQRIAKSFLDLRKEKEERFKRLSEASIGDESRKIAFEIMHFMEDKQWMHISDVVELLEKE